MSTQLEGLDCVVCHSHLFDDDDVVYCPVCGAPHHRDCYQSVGHCALENAHGTDREYKRPAPKAETEPAHTAQAQGDAPAQPRFCSSCGEKLNDTAMFCPKCGRATTAQAHTPYGANRGASPYQGFVIDPLGGVGADEKIEDIPARELAQYVAVNPNRYIPLFKKLGKGHRVNWNWAAFLFPSGWMWYRKCYKQGLIFIILAILCTVLTFPFQLVLESLPVSDTATYQQLMQSITENIDQFTGLPWVLYLVSFLLNLGTRIVAGLFGDSIYRANAIEQIKKLREGENYPETLRMKGGVNLTALLLALLLVNWIPVLLMMLL